MRATRKTGQMNRAIPQPAYSPADAGFASAVPDNYRTPGSFRQTETGIGPSTTEVLRTLSAMERLLLN